MLSQAERKYLHICTQSQAHPELTHTQLGELIGIPERTVRRAVAWGSKMGVLDSMSAEQLKEHIAEHRKHLDWIEKERKLYIKSLRDPETGKRRAADPYRVQSFTSSIQQVRTKLMELEGIYRNVLSVDLNAPDGFKLEVEYVTPSNQ